MKDKKKKISAEDEARAVGDGEEGLGSLFTMLRAGLDPLRQCCSLPGPRGGVQGVGRLEKDVPQGSCLEEALAPLHLLEDGGECGTRCAQYRCI